MTNDYPADYRGSCVTILSKDAANLSDPNPVEATHIENYLLGNYPPDAIRWVRDAKWIGPVLVPQSRVDYADEQKWAASRQPATVARFARKIGNGTGHTKPVIAVQQDGNYKVNVVDGHHRALAYRKLGRPIVAYVGFVARDDDRWEATHSSQVHSGSSPRNKQERLSVAKGSKKLKKKLAKRVLAGEITVDDARRKLGRNITQKTATPTGVIAAAGRPVTEFDLLDALRAPVAAPPVVKTVKRSKLVKAAGRAESDRAALLTKMAEGSAALAATDVRQAAENALAAAVSGPVHEVVGSQQRRFEEAAARIRRRPAAETLKDLKEAHARALSPAGVKVRQFEHVWRTSADPAERESAYAAIMKIRGIN
jgi:hypothetical protein